MLPEVDGISIARRVREKKWTPIIMTTARETLQDRLLWFEVGAVDYMVKPFNLWELLARMNVHLAKGENSWVSQTPKWITIVAGIEINLKKHTFSKQGENIHLTQKEFLIAEKLISQSDRVVSRSDIIEYLWWWDSLFEWDNKLDVYISNIRSKLWKSFIKTTKWVGYMIWD
jgi:two-component system response regulator QseB